MQSTRFMLPTLFIVLGLFLSACVAPTATGPTTGGQPAAEEKATEAPQTLAKEEVVAGDPWINQCEGEPKDGGEVVLAFADQAMRGENWLSRSSTNEGFLFSQLVDLDINTLEIVPDVAESCSSRKCTAACSPPASAAPGCGG